MASYESVLQKAFYAFNGGGFCHCLTQRTMSKCNLYEMPVELCEGMGVGTTAVRMMRWSANIHIGCCSCVVMFVNVACSLFVLLCLLKLPVVRISSELINQPTY